MLAELMRLKQAVAIAGTHGKTTTTSMVAALLVAGGLDPTVINGGIINAYGTNARMGASDWMVVEADESDGTFVKLPVDVALVTNIDPEHLDYYGTFDRAREAYRHFIENVPFYGFAVMCIDHPEVQALIGRIEDRRIITYGASPQADVRYVDLGRDGRRSTFTALIRDRATGKTQAIENLSIAMPGEHNVQNATGAVAVAHHLGIPVERLKTIAIVAVAAATGASVAVSGGIGFVGIVVPHLLRLVIGPDHKYLLPASALLGAAFLLFADTVSRIIVAPAELPIGIVTAAVGGPFFLWLLLRGRNRLAW